VHALLRHDRVREASRLVIHEHEQRRFPDLRVIADRFIDAAEQQIAVQHARWVAAWMLGIRRQLRHKPAVVRQGPSGAIGEEAVPAVNMRLRPCPDVWEDFAGHERLVAVHGPRACVVFQGFEDGAHLRPDVRALLVQPFPTYISVRGRGMRKHLVRCRGAGHRAEPAIAHDEALGQLVQNREAAIGEASKEASLRCRVERVDSRGEAMHLLQWGLIVAALAPGLFRHCVEAVRRIESMVAHRVCLWCKAVLVCVQVSSDESQHAIKGLVLKHQNDDMLNGAFRCVRLEAIVLDHVPNISTTVGRHINVTLVYV